MLNEFFRGIIFLGGALLFILGIVLFKEYIKNSIKENYKDYKKYMKCNSLVAIFLGGALIIFTAIKIFIPLFILLIISVFVLTKINQSYGKLNKDIR